MKCSQQLMDYIISFVKIGAMQAVLYPATYRIFVTNGFNNQINAKYNYYFFL